MRPSASSQEELRKLIKTEVASLLAPYERLLEEAKTAIAGKDAEIASLKLELTAVKAQVKSSAVPAAEPMSPPDPKCQLGTHDLRHMQRECRDLSKEAREAAHKYKLIQQAGLRLRIEWASSPPSNSERSGYFRVRSS